MRDLRPEKGTIAALKFFSEDEVKKLPDRDGSEASLIPGSLPYICSVCARVRGLIIGQKS